MREPKCPIAGMVCPRNADPEQGKYCPAWSEVCETNTATGEERIVKGCVFQQIPRWMTHVVEAANRPAAAVESTRNEIANGFANLTRSLPQIVANAPKSVEDKHSGTDDDG